MNNHEKYALNLSNVYVNLDGNVVLEDISFKLEEGKFLTIIGPNGAGKTTLLKTIVGLMPYYKGSIRVFGKELKQNIDKIRRIIGYVPQKDSVVKTIPIRVIDVVAMGRKSIKGSFSLLTKKDYKIIRESLEIVDMWDLRYKRYSQLSGGQQQRTLIARALSINPKILLLDEALSGVDIASEETILDALKKISSKGVTVLYVTHDINEVYELTDYILLLNKRVIAFGKPDEVLKESILEKVYGKKVKVIWREDQCIALIGDKHA